MNKYFIIIIVSMLLYITYDLYWKKVYKNRNNQMFEFIRTGDKKGLINFLSIKPQLTSEWIHYGCLYWHLYSQTKDMLYLKKAEFYFQCALELSPHDYMLLHHFAVVLIKEHNYTQGMDILKYLIKKFPSNAVYQNTIGKAYYLQNRKELALSHFVQMIELQPSILNTKEWYEFSKIDSCICQKIQVGLEEKIKMTQNDPIILAKYGRIALSLQKFDLAQKHLSRAVELLPNMTEPWRNLAILAQQNKEQIYKNYESKFIFLNNNQIANSDILCSNGSFVSENEILFAKYLVKYITWYNNASSIEILAVNLSYI